MRVWSLGREDPLEKDMATHFNIFAWRIPRAEEPGRLWSIGSYRVGQDWRGLACMHAPCYRNCGSLGQGTGLHGCTTLGTPSCGDLLKMGLLVIATCTNVCVVLWNSIFVHFILGVLSVLSLLQCVYVYMSMSASRHLSHLSLFGSLCECRSERIIGRKARGLQTDKIACKCQTFLSLKQQEETN